MAGGAIDEARRRASRRLERRRSAGRHRRAAGRARLVNLWAFVFVIGLLISIFLHELGHFVTARWTGMKATQFFLFMGRSCSASVAARPSTACASTGRRVRADHRDEQPRRGGSRRRGPAYRNKSYPRRMLVITAGSMMHFLIAIVLLFAVYADQRRRGRPGWASAAFSVVQPGRPGWHGGRRHRVADRRCAARAPTTRRSQTPRPAIVTLVLARDGTLTKCRPRSQPDRRRRARHRSSGSVRATRRLERPGLVAAAAATASSTSGQRCGRASGRVKVLNPVNIGGHLTGSNATRHPPDNRRRHHRLGDDR